MSWIVLLMVAGGAAPDKVPRWHNNYRTARHEAAVWDMPLLLIFDSPDTPHRHAVTSAGPTNHQETKLLAKYVRCHIDVSSEYGAKVAAIYKVATLPHTVIIEHTGKYQVFVHRGPMNDAQWIGALTGYRPPPPPPIRYCPP